MAAERGKLAILCLGGLLAAAFAPPRLPLAADAAANEVLLTADGSVYQVASGGAASGDQYPRIPGAEAPSPAVASPAAEPASKRDAWRLTVDAGAVGDSNFTNGPRADTVAIDLGTGPLPMPLDPNLRARSGAGGTLGATAGARLAIAPGVAVAADFEGYAVEYRGSESDDVSALAAAGLEFGASDAPDAAIQLIAFDRWYGGTSVAQGFGLRGSMREGAGGGRTLRLAVDARVFDSGYGERFGGKSFAFYAALDTVFAPRLSASLGLHGRREWLRDDAFSSLDMGAYAGLSAFIGEDLAGGATLGLSRTLFDRPYLLLGPDPRRDWRGYGSLWIAARRPVILGILPSLTYTYSRAASSIDYYDSDRHRLRLGLQRRF